MTEAPVLSTFGTLEDPHRLVDSLQESIAVLMRSQGNSLAGVPRLTIQVLIYALARRAKNPHSFKGSFQDLTEKSQAYGSPIFARDGSSHTLFDVLQTFRQLTVMPNGHLLDLLCRALDYGRSNEWIPGSRQVERRRNLALAKAGGVFYTPVFIARHLSSTACNPYLSDGANVKKPPRICDPALGSGVLLLAAAERLLRVYSAREVLESLYGADIDGVAAEAAAIMLAIVCEEWEPGTRPPSLGTRVVIGDAYGGPVIGGQHCARVSDDSIDWRATFPAVFSGANPGFDVVLTNPPFGRFKVDADWAQAREMKLSVNDVVLLREQSRSLSIKLKESRLYKYSTKGVIDKSRIGLERAGQVTRDDGYLGAVIPSTINADHASAPLREHFLRAWDLFEINEFPEDARLFHGVNQSVSVMVARKGTATRAVGARSAVYSARDLQKPYTAKWPIHVIERASARMAIPVRASYAEDVLEAVHAHPPLSSFSAVINLRGEVDVTVYKDHLTSDSSMTPLVRGDQIDSFRADLPSVKEAFVDSNALAAKLNGSSKAGHVSLPRIVGRQCSYLYRERRLSFAMVPPHRAVANSCNYLIIGDEDLRFYVLGLLNSTLLNWRFKLFNSNNHVANSEIGEFPIPHPHTIDTKLFTRIQNRARELTDSYSYAGLAALDALVFEAYGLTAPQIKGVSS